MFDKNALNGGRFLEIVSDNIDDSDLALLAGRGGFGPPNDFDYRNILSLLREHRFPDCDYYEYEWAIHECGYDAISMLPSWARLFIASLYIYCNKLKQWSTDIESDYYYMILVSELEEGTTERSFWFLQFIEWLYECVPQDQEGYEDYFLLLSWVLLRRLRGDANEQVFDSVMDMLRRKNMSIDVFGRYTVSAIGINSWMEIHRRIPLRYQYSSEDYEKILFGRSG